MLAYAKGMGLNHIQGIKTHIDILFKNQPIVKYLFTKVFKNLKWTFVGIVYMDKC